MTNNTNNTVHAYISGACTVQTGNGGWGIVLTREGKRKQDSGKGRNTTGNKMVLTAAIEALRIIIKNNAEKPIVVTTSNQYVVDGVNNNLDSWKSNGWKNANKKPVANQDLWRELDKLNQMMNVTWVKGNKGDVEVDKADALAREAKVA